MTKAVGRWEAYINPGERILWEGRPAGQLFIFRAIDSLLIPFSIMWAVFTAESILSAPRSGLLVVAFDLIFLAACVYFTIGRFILDQYIRRRTVYALTDKRALIATSAFGRKFRTLPISPALSIKFKDRERGSVWLGRRPSIFTIRKLIGVWSGNDGGFTFRSIETPEVVFNLLQKIQRGKI